MDSHELRKGNLVDAEGVVVQVVSLDGDSQEIEITAPGNKRNRVKLALVRPIPVTSDTLSEYFSFDKQGRHVVGIDKHRYYLKMHDGYVILLNQKSEPLIHFWDVRYVHQLQNLYYALKGEEMMVSLGRMEEQNI
ncbi:MAG: hypothetical protein V4649_15080 [Bacteroidota bacterium]